RVSVQLAQAVGERLQELGFAAVDKREGFVVDDTDDLARVFYVANTVKAVPRRDGTRAPRASEVLVLDPSPIDWAALTSEGGCEPKARAVPPTGRPARGGDHAEFRDAADAWIAAHPRSYPRNSG